MNALILMAVLAGPPECPTIRISAGGEELVIRKLSPRVDVSIHSSPSDNLKRGIIPWGDLFIEFDGRMTEAETDDGLRRLRESRTRQIGRRGSHRKTSNPVTSEARVRARADLATEEIVKRQFDEMEEEISLGILSLDVTKEDGMWKVTYGRQLLAEASVAAAAP